MIHDAIEYIRKEVRDTLVLDDAEVLVGNVATLKEGNARGVYISVVNVQEETALKNTSHFVRQNNTTRYQQPPVYLNLYMLVAFDFGDYDTSLMRLTQAIELFQAKPLFSTENDSASNPFPSALERLVFDFHNLNVEQLNHFWGILGGSYLPSVLYKVRVIKVQRDESIAAPEITTIEVTTNAE